MLSQFAILQPLSSRLRVRLAWVGILAPPLSGYVVFRKLLNWLSLLPRLNNWAGTDNTDRGGSL